MRANKLSSNQKIEEDSKNKKVEEEEEEYDEEEEEEEDDEDEILPNSKISEEKMFQKKFFNVTEPIKENLSKPIIVQKEETKPNVPASTIKGVYKTKIIPNKANIKSAIEDINRQINLSNKLGKIENPVNNVIEKNKNSNSIYENINDITKELKMKNHIEKIENKIIINTNINVVNQNQINEQIKKSEENIFHKNEKNQDILKQENISCQKNNVNNYNDEFKEKKINKEIKDDKKEDLNTKGIIQNKIIKIDNFEEIDKFINNVKLEEKKETKENKNEEKDKIDVDKKSKLPEAKKNYVDESIMKENGIEIVQIPIEQHNL